MTTSTDAAPISVYDYVRTKPAKESTYTKAEELLDKTLAISPFGDQSVGTDDHGRKLYPRDYLEVATVVLNLAIMTSGYGVADDEAQAS